MTRGGPALARRATTMAPSAAARARRQRRVPRGPERGHADDAVDGALIEACGTDEREQRLDVVVAGPELAQARQRRLLSRADE